MMVELVAGILEPEDRGPEGLMPRAQVEAHEEEADAGEIDRGITVCPGNFEGENGGDDKEEGSGE